MTTQFEIGDEIRVREAFPPGHIRTPHYIRGREGIITEKMGEFYNPEELAKGIKEPPKKMLYRVRFFQKDAWPNYDGPKQDTLDLDIYEHWLEAKE